MERPDPVRGIQQRGDDGDKGLRPTTTPPQRPAPRDTNHLQAAIIGDQTNDSALKRRRGALRKAPRYAEELHRAVKTWRECANSPREVANGSLSSQPPTSSGTAREASTGRDVRAANAAVAEWIAAVDRSTDEPGVPSQPGSPALSLRPRFRRKTGSYIALFRGALDALSRRTGPRRTTSAAIAPHQPEVARRLLRRSC